MCVCVLMICQYYLSTKRFWPSNGQPEPIAGQRLPGVGECVFKYLCLCKRHSVTSGFGAIWGEAFVRLATQVAGASHRLIDGLFVTVDRNEQRPCSTHQQRGAIRKGGIIIEGTFIPSGGQVWLHGKPCRFNRMGSS